MKSILHALRVHIVGRPQRMVRLAWVFCAILIPLYLLGKLADEVWEREPFAWDDPVLLLLKSHASPELDRFFLFFTLLGAARITVPVTIAIQLYIWKCRPNVEALFFGTAAFGAMLMTLPSKLVFGRPRPDLWISIAPETTHSFPSGHAMTSMAIAAAICVLAWHTRGRLPVLVIAAFYVVIVGVSRLYLGVHFPSDVLAGWCAALVWVFSVHGVWYAHEKQYWQRGRDLWGQRKTTKSSAES